MSRYKGTFIFGANFEGGSTVPIDARQLVCTYADLTLPATWCFSPVCSSMALYDGMLTVVASGAGSGVYWLCDAVNYTTAGSWVKLGGGTGAGTLTGATNGLSLVGVSGTTVSLGGTLTGNTIINIDGKTLTLSGTTGKILSFVGTPTSYSYACVDANYVTLETVNATNGAFIDINKTGNTITTCAKGGNLLYCTNNNMFITAPSGATYGGDYEANFTSRSLVTRSFVESKLNTVCTVLTNADPYTISSAAIGFVGVSGVTECIYLYASPSNGQRITITDVCGDALANPIYIDGNGKCINDNGTAMINTNFGSITFIYNNIFWSAVAFVN
ncbi:MAG: hypothetical protein WC333_00855 [Dehalococcoidia bacterium]|jgi:hypothetical protein